MKILKSILLICITASYTYGQVKKEQDIQAIKSLCGCYEIDFEYTETFSPDTTYAFHNDYITHAGAELAFVIEETENFISIQHLLVVGDNMIIKHWREDWVYENEDLLEFKTDLSWGYKSLTKEEAKGTWTQKVFQVDDSPRYEGYATWIHADGRHFWHSKTYGPLPRREYSHRSDYNVLYRNNRIELTEYGWLHEQDNSKIVRDENANEQLLAQEKGFNTYKLQDASKCEAAAEWWKKNAPYWEVVRAQWQKIYDEKKGVNLAIKVEEQTLWQALFALGSNNEAEKMGKPKTVASTISSAIEKFRISES